MAAYEITLAQAMQDLEIKQISNTCTDSDEFIARINQAQEALVKRGGWFDLERRISFSLRGTRLVWPHFVGTVLAVRFCGNVAVMQNQWFSFVENNDPNGWNGSSVYGGGFNGAYGGGYVGNGAYASAGNQTQAVIVDGGTAPIYNEIPDGGMMIRYNVVNPNDYGKKITLFGRQYGGQPLQEDDGNGMTVMGQTLTAARPYAQTSNLITDIESIVREPTEGMAYLYGYDATLNLQYDLGVFQPNETNPRYRVSLITNIPQGIRNRQTSGENCRYSCEALVKLKFLPLRSLNDFLPISDRRATKLAIKAIQAEDADDEQGSQINWSKALEELEMNQDSTQPKRQIPVRINLGRPLVNPI